MQPDPNHLAREIADLAHKQAAKQLGLWDRIRMKKERGGKPAQPGDKDYPDSKSWKKVTSISKKPQKQASDKPCSCGCGDTVTTCKCSADCSCKQKGGSCYNAEKQAAKSPAWQRAAGKNEEGGLNAKGRASYNKATGGNLKAPVTEKNPKGESAKRQNSFCARMCGMKRVNTGAKSKKDPDSRINKSLRKWNCKCGSEEEKQAVALPGLIGAFAGAAGGGLTGKKDKVNRAIGRGALIGAATELGMYPGMALGTIPGFLLGNALAGPGGGVPGAVIGGGLGMGAGGMLGNAAAQGLLGPYETPEELAEEKETKEEKKMANAFEFGKKLAEVTTCSAPKHNDQAGVDVNPVAAGTPEGKEKLTKKKLPLKAEDVVTSKAAEFGRKLAQSLVNFVERKPKDLTKGTLNPMAAGEHEEEVEEPESEEDDGLIV